MLQGNASEFSVDQLKAIHFLAAGKVDTSGKRWTIEEFCEKVLKVHFTTFYRWQSDVRFRQAVLEEVMGRSTQFVPAMVTAQIQKAMKKQDTPAFMAIMRQAGIIRADRSEAKTENTGVVGTYDLTGKDDKELDAFIAKYSGGTSA